MTKPWQVFSHNGAPVPGAGADRDEFKRDTQKVKAGSHVWFWRKTNGTTEVAVQKRAADKVSWAGYLDISAAGHVDLGETFLQAAIREAKEELGYDLIPEKLVWLFACRSAVNYYEMDHIYTYEVGADAVFAFDDGEVESVDWYLLTQFAKMTSNPEEFHMVPQGRHYFAQLIEFLEQQ